MATKSAALAKNNIVCGLGGDFCDIDIPGDFIKSQANRPREDDDGSS